MFIFKIKAITFESSRFFFSVFLGSVFVSWSAYV